MESNCEAIDAIKNEYVRLDAEAGADLLSNYDFSPTGLGGTNGIGGTNGLDLGNYNPGSDSSE